MPLKQDSEIILEVQSSLDLQYDEAGCYTSYSELDLTAWNVTRSS